MAGSNGSPIHRGSQAQKAWPPESEDEARALEYERWQQHQRQLAAQNQPAAQPQHAHYTHVAGPVGQYAGEPGHPPHGDAWASDPHAQQQARHGAPYAPQFEPYQPNAAHAPQAPANPYERAAGYEAPTHYDAQQSQAGYDPRYAAQRAPQAPFPSPDQAGHHGAYAPEPQHAAPRADVQSWDLSHYSPGQTPHGYAGGHQQQPQQAGWPPPAQHGAHGAGEPQWQQQGQAYWPPGAAAGQAQYQPHAQPGFDPNAAPHDPAYDGDDIDAPEERRRGPSTLVIVGALVGAIVTGGGLAYAYKMFGGGGATKGNPQVVRADASPVKTKPANPGGMTVEHSDKKFVNSLSSNSDSAVPTSLKPPAPSAPKAGDVDGGAKKVSTITINVNKDNTISPEVVRPAPVPAAPVVPGLIIDTPLPPPSAPAAAASVPPTVRRAPPPPPEVRSPPTPPPVQPKVVTAPPPAQPKVASAAPAQPAAAAPDAEATPRLPKRPVAKTQTTAVRDDLLAPKDTGAPPSGLGSAAADAARKSAPAGGSGGFVAVLASKKSRQDAITSFPELHQKFPDLLNGLTPDVREVDLRDKGGVWYRLVVGPPGSRQAATGLCAKLKERGMKDCWAAPY